MAAHTMTPKRKAALRKAQLASARKRRKGGKVRAHLRRHGATYVAGAALVGYAASSAAVSHRNRKHRARASATRRKVQHSNLNATNAAIKKGNQRSAFYRKTAPRRTGVGPTSSNRIFVTNSHGKTGVRRRYH